MERKDYIAEGCVIFWDGTLPAFLSEVDYCEDERADEESMQSDQEEVDNKGYR